MMVSCVRVVGNGWFGARRNGAALAIGSGAEVAATATGLAVGAGAAVGLAGSVAAQAFKVTTEIAVRSAIFFMNVPDDGMDDLFAFGNAFAARVCAALPTG